MSRIPKVVPPRSVVVLTSADRKKTPDWLKDLGWFFRIGYYNQEDGLDCIWLVNERGKYEQTTDRDALLQYFAVLHVANETDLYGQNRPPLRPLNLKHMPASAIPSLLARTWFARSQLA